MKERGLIVVSLNEIAERWQVPVSVIQYFITDCGMPVEEKERGRWFAEHTDLILEEKRKVFESNLFPKEIQKEGDLL